MVVRQQGTQGQQDNKARSAKLALIISNQTIVSGGEKKTLELHYPNDSVLINFGYLMSCYSLYLNVLQMNYR